MSKCSVSSNCFLFFSQVLWPGGTFFTKIGNIQSKFDNSHPNQTPSQNFSQFGGSNVSKPGSFEQQLEATCRASDIKKMLFSRYVLLMISCHCQIRVKICHDFWICDLHACSSLDHCFKWFNSLVQSSMITFLIKIYEVLLCLVYPNMFIKIVYVVKSLNMFIIKIVHDQFICIYTRISPRASTSLMLKITKRLTFFSDGAPTTLVSLIGHKQYRSKRHLLFHSG